MPKYFYRDAKTGRAVTEEYASHNPDTTVRETERRVTLIRVVDEIAGVKAGWKIELDHVSGILTIQDEAGVPIQAVRFTVEK